MTQIKIIEICPMAMTEEQGLLVRNAMAPIINDNKPIVLDFDGIFLFATMFFNASVGHYIIEKGVDYCTQNIRLINISDLGEETYKHSFLNAKEIVESSGDLVANSSLIAETNIEEC